MKISADLVVGTSRSAGRIVIVVIKLDLPPKFSKFIGTSSVPLLVFNASGLSCELMNNWSCVVYHSKLSFILLSKRIHYTRRVRLSATILTWWMRLKWTFCPLFFSGTSLSNWRKFSSVSGNSFFKDVRPCSKTWNQKYPLIIIDLAGIIRE